MRSDNTGKCIGKPILTEPPAPDSSGDSGGGGDGGDGGCGGAGGGGDGSGDSSTSGLLSFGNPIQGATGSKTQFVSLYASGGMPRLFLGFIYSSRQSNTDHQPNYGFGIDWISTYSHRINGASPDTPTVLSITRPNGRNIEFSQQADTVTYLPDAANRNMRLLRLKNSSGTTTGWRLKVEDVGVTEDYDANGLLMSVNSAQGQVQSFTNDATWRLTSIADGWGRSIVLNYSIENRVASITLPDTSVIELGYDTANHLTSLSYPGIPVKYFLYEDARFPNALTGINDENGIRYATFAYDASGKTMSTVHAGDVNRYQLAYGAGTTVAIDPLGTERTYSFATVLNVSKSTGASQPGGSGCGPSASAVAYDANGNIASRIDFNGHTATYTYDLSRNLELTRIEGSGTAQARTISAIWHPDWRLEAWRAEPKKLTTWIYSGQPDPTQGGAAASCAPADALLPDGKPIAVLCKKIEQPTTDATGASGFAATVTGSPRNWNWTYSRYGQVLTADGPRTDVSDLTAYTYYDASDTDIGKRGNLATVTNALGHVTRYTAYDLNGRPLTIVDANGNPVTVTYTPRGWLDSLTIGGQTTAYSYDPVGQLTRITRPDGGHTDYGYDAAHRLMSITDTRGDVLSYSRDNAGNVTRSDWLNPDSSLARSRRFAYDALGRLQNVIDTRNGVDASSTYGYDANGKLIQADDAKSQRTATARDSLGRPTQVTDPLQGLTRLVHDGQDRLSQLTAPNNAQTTFTVDGLGNVTQETSANRGNRSASYDEAGNLKTLTDARGITATHTWDALNRPLTVRYPSGGADLTYTWDTGSGCTHGIGRLCQLTDAGGTTSYAYDARGNLASETRNIGGISLTTQYAYDSADRLTTVIAPSGKVLTTPRDPDGDIQSVATRVADTQVDLVKNIGRDAVGNTTAQTFGNGLQETRTYGQDGLPTRVIKTVPGGDPAAEGDVPLPGWALLLLGGSLLGIARRSRAGAPRGLTILLLSGMLAGSLPAPAWADDLLSYDANGNIVQATTPTGTTTYGYDALDRVKSEAGPVQSQNFGYDLGGNRTSDASGTHTYTPNTDRAATIAGQSVTLDAAGHITQLRNLGLVWNPAGQLKEVHQANPTGPLLASYEYDGRGRRSRKTTTASAPQGAGTTIYLYDQYNRPLVEADGNGHPLITYVWRDEVPVSLIVHGNPESVIYLETDHLDTPRVARNQNRSIVWRWDSDAFGSTPAKEDPDGDGQGTTINLRFAGQYYDQESGLHYNWHRYYDPMLGRYLSPDPIGTVLYRDMAAKSLAASRGFVSPELASQLYREQPEFNHPYGYVGSNPLSSVDPFGLSKFDKTYGLPKEFWTWYHRKHKKPGDPDLEKEEAKELCEQWKNDGRPKPDNKQRGSSDQDLLDWLLPWWLYSGDAH